MVGRAPVRVLAAVALAALLLVWEAEAWMHSSKCGSMHSHRGGSCDSCLSRRPAVTEENVRKESADADDIRHTLGSLQSVLPPMASMADPKKTPKQKMSCKWLAPPQRALSAMTELDRIAAPRGCCVADPEERLLNKCAAVLEAAVRTEPTIVRSSRTCPADTLDGSDDGGVGASGTGGTGGSPGKSSLRQKRMSPQYQDFAKAKELLVALDGHESRLEQIIIGWTPLTVFAASASCSALFTELARAEVASRMLLPLIYHTSPFFPPEDPLPALYNGLGAPPASFIPVPGAQMIPGVSSGGAGGGDGFGDEDDYGEGGQASGRGRRNRHSHHHHHHHHAPIGPLAGVTVVPPDTSTWAGALDYLVRSVGGIGLLDEYHESRVADFVTYRLPRVCAILECMLQPDRTRQIEVVGPSSGEPLGTLECGMCPLDAPNTEWLIGGARTRIGDALRDSLIPFCDKVRPTGVACVKSASKQLGAALEDLQRAATVADAGLGLKWAMDALEASAKALKTATRTCGRPRTSTVPKSTTKAKLTDVEAHEERYTLESQQWPDKAGEA